MDNFGLKTFSFTDAHPDILIGTTAFNQDYCFPDINGTVKLYLCDDYDLNEPFKCNTCDAGAHLHPDGFWCSSFTCPAGSKAVSATCQKCDVKDCKF